MPISKELQEQLEKLSETERTEVMASLKGSEDADVSDEAFNKAAEKIAEAILSKKEEKVEATKEAGEEVKKALHSFDQETNAGADLKAVYGVSLDEMIKQKEVPSHERVAKYAEAKKTNDVVYLRQVNARIATFFKALFENNEPVVRALIEGTDAEGGYLVPDEFRAELIQELNNSVVMRRLATVVPMTSKSMELPALLAKPHVSWTTEDATIGTSSADFGNITLTPYKLTARLPVTRELAADSAIAVVSLLTRVFADAVSDEEDKAFWTGNGSGKPTGVDNYTLKTIAAGASKADSLVSLQHKLKAAYRGRASWVMNTNTLRDVRTLKDSTGQYLFSREAIREGAPATLLGSPVYEQNNLPAGKIFYGDFSYYYIGDREQVSVESTTEGGTAWTQDRIEIKVRERVDGELGLTRAVVEGTGY